jgi:hypothetical protein
VAELVHGLLRGARQEEARITWRAPELLSQASQGDHGRSTGPRKPEHEVQVWYEQIEISESEHAFSIRLQWGKLFKNDLSAVLAPGRRPRFNWGWELPW